MALNYTTWVTGLANLMVQDPTDPNYLTFLPDCIDYVEQRTYRELDLLYTRTVDTTGNFTMQQQFFTIPSANGSFVVVEQINAVTPAGAPAATGSRVPLIPVTKEFINATYPSNTLGTGVPTYFAPVSNEIYIVAPSPDASYVAEVVGTIRPAPLSVTNSSTFLTQNLPDIFMAGSMIYAAGYQRDFGMQTDNPPSAVSWEAQYTKLMGSAAIEELRKKFMGPAWQAMTPSPVATPPRV